jgi:hypothetical protein
MIISQWRSGVAATVFLLSSFAVTAQGGKTFKARLAPVPVDLTMTPTVAGSGAVTAVLAGNKLTISGTFDGLKSPATIAQVHKGPIAGVRGPVVFDLTVSKGTNGTISGSADLTPLQLTDLEKRRLYVQLHSEKAPDGNLWGWLVAQENKK